METLDLSKEQVPERIVDREFDQRFLKDTIGYLKNIRDNSVDYIADTQKLEVRSKDDKEWQLWVDSPDGLKVFTPTNWAKNQTIGATELPKKYHDTLVEKGHINEAVNHMNMWLHESEDKKRVRTVAGDYRALVSPGYNPFDNYDAFITIANSLKAANMMRSKDQPPAMYYKTQLSDHNMYVHIIDEGRPYDLGKGDTYKPMLIFKNSEVGDGAMVVEAGLWRSMCSNLMLQGVISRRIHKGEKLAEGIYAADTMETQNELWKKILRDSLNAGLASDQLFDKIVADISESKEIKIEDSIVAVEQIKKAEKLTDAEEKAIIDAMMGDTTIPAEEKHTLFQIQNGMTQAAKTMGIERGIEMQRIAGNIQALIKVVA
jgi:hypothetical protein